MDGRLERLGLGGESSVYALDAERVLRVLHGPSSIDGRESLLGELGSESLPFRIPRVLDAGELDGIAYTIEDRIAGRTLTDVLADLDGEMRRRALIDFADAALALSGIRAGREWFGYVARRGATRHEHWSDFLVEQVANSVASQREALVKDVPSIDAVLASFADEAQAVAHVDAGIAHGDYFPGNVMVDDDLRVIAVIDFGVLTVYGDRRLDVASAVIFFDEPHQWNRPGDAALLTAHLSEHVPTLPDVLGLYRTYYALYFTHAREDDALLYGWCVRVLNDAYESSGRNRA